MAAAAAAAAAGELLWQSRLRVDTVIVIGETRDYGTHDALREMALCTMAVAEGDSQRPILISCLLPVASLCVT